MKKIILPIVIVLGIVLSVLFGFQIKIDKVINSKIAELNENGFIVKHSQTTNYLKTKAMGELEVIYPDKVASYIFKNMENNEFKNSIESQYNLLNANEKELFFEGIKLDYDFVLGNFNGKFNTNIYLTNLSKKTMYNLTQDAQNQNNQWLLEFLKNKKLQLSINENNEYKIADIDTLIPNEAFITIRDIKGVGSNIAISYLKISNADGNRKDLFQMNNLNIEYFKDANNENSKITVKNINFEDETNNFYLSNLTLNSKYQKDDVNIATKGEISFDEIVVKNSNQEVANLKKSSLSVDVSKLPIKKIEEITNYLENKKFDEYIKSLFESGLAIDFKGEASNYVINNLKMLNILKFNSNVQLNKNFSVTNVPNIENLLETIKLNIDLDVDAATNLKSFLTAQLGTEVAFVDAENDLKRFEVVLNGDEVFINNKKVFNKKDLKPTVGNISQGGLFYEYKMLENNQLQLDIKYFPNMTSISSGGVSVSFPQLLDKTRIIKYTTESFELINFYKAGSEIWNGGLEKNIFSKYLLVEGWDDNWSDSSKFKDLSLIIDVKGLDTLKVNLRAGSLNDVDLSQKDSEIVPEEGELDQQDYPIKFIEIPLAKVK